MSFLSIFAASSCGGGGFFHFPTWYMYLPGRLDSNNVCVPVVANLNDIWLIVAAVVEILLRIAMLVAVGMVIFGGFQFMLAQGDANQASKARKTLTDALVGLIISIAAATVITFIAGSFS